MMASVTQAIRVECRPISDCERTRIVLSDGKMINDWKKYGSVRDLIEIRLYLSGRAEKNHEILSHDRRMNFEL
jgi:hypothetical protein